MPTPFQTLRKRYDREKKEKEKPARRTIRRSRTFEKPAEPATADPAEATTETGKEID